MTFEYKILHWDELQDEYKSARKSGDEERDFRAYQVDHFNDLGRNGWELVSVSTGDWQILGSGGTVKASYFFKRSLG